MKPNVFQETGAAIAQRFGITSKALRVYERLGLIKPRRNTAGWRIYQQPEIERLGAILALRQMGLPLKRIGALLKGAGELDAVLELQESALLAARAQSDQALALVRLARQRLAQHGRLSPDEVGNLIRSTTMTELKWTPEMEALAQKHYTPEQLQELRARPFSAADQAHVSTAWAKVFAEIDALGPDADPATEKALEIGRRAQALIQEFTQGDEEMFKAAGAFNREAMQSGAGAAQPGWMRPAHWQFMGRVFAAMKAGKS